MDTRCVAWRLPSNRWPAFAQLELRYQGWHHHAQLDGQRIALGRAVGSPDADRWAPLLEQIRAKGGTPLGQYIKEGADELLRLRAKEPFETYRLLIVTDGEASDAPYLASILPDLVSRGISMDVIGVAMKEQHSLAKSAHTYRSADDPATLTAVLEMCLRKQVAEQTRPSKPTLT